MAQTYPHWELLIVDDGSTDETETVVGQVSDNRIIYIREEHENQQTARNYGMEIAKGDLIAYLDSDNVLYPKYLERMTEEFSTHTGVVWGFPKGDRIKELYRDGVLITRIDDSDDFPEEVSPQSIFHRKLHTDTSGAMHTRNVIDDGIRWDPTIFKMEDWDFFLTLADTYPDGFLYVKEKLYTYTQRYGGDGLVSNTSYRDWAVLFEQIYQKHKESPLMEGQTWYPDKVKKWNTLADEFDAGRVPPYHEYYFT